MYRRELPPFTEIYVFDNFEVELVKDTAHFVELHAGENLMSNLKTEVSNGILKLENINKCNWVRSYNRTLKAVVHAPDFRIIVHDGYNTVRTRGTLVQDTIRLDITDAGDFDCTLQSNRVHTTLYEYGNITLKGSASLFVFENYGVGKVYAQELPAGAILGHVSGQGDNHVNPLDYLNVTFLNSGNVYYYNQPLTPTERLGAGAGQLIEKP